MGIEGGITVETNEQEVKHFISRLRRLAGQAKSLETSLISGDSAKFVGQLQAVIEAGRAALTQYASFNLIDSQDPQDKALLKRIIRG